MLWLLECIFVGPCAAHIAQTAFEWGLWSEFHDKDLLRNAYITIEALRNSFDLLVRHLGIWLSTVLSFVPALDSDAVNDLHELWVTLGLDPDLALHFAETLQLRWQSGKLLVNDVIRDCQPTTLVYNAFLAILRFRPFTSSRWLSMGGSARTLVSLLIVGLPDLVRYIRDETGASLFFLNGYDRLTPDVVRLFASVCFVSRPTDAVLLLLLEDGRIARQMQNIRDCLVEEMEFLSEVSFFVWDTVASVANMTPEELQTKPMDAAHLSVGFVHKHLLAVYDALPWSLLQGDIEANLVKFSAGLEPAEKTASKIWIVATSGSARGAGASSLSSSPPTCLARRGQRSLNTAASPSSSGNTLTWMSLHSCLAGALAS